jgi:hypothetical protein
VVNHNTTETVLLGQLSPDEFIVFTLYSKFTTGQLVTSLFKMVRQLPGGFVLSYMFFVQLLKSC